MTGPRSRSIATWPAPDSDPGPAPDSDPGPAPDSDPGAPLLQVSHAAIWAPALLLALSLTGCAKLMQDMYDQAKYEPLEPSPLFADNLSSRTPIAGTIAQTSGAFADTSSGRLGAPKFIGAWNPSPVAPTEARNLALTRMPFPATIKLLQRGQERYNIYCSPCHSRSGDGDGMVVRRGFPRPPSYHTDALRHAPLSHFYSVITQGYGVMYAYADRVNPHDRWAIAAYIRALQLSQHARLADLPASVRSKLELKPQ